MMNDKMVSKLTYIMPPHVDVEARMQQSKTITNMEKHEQEEPTKTITNTTGSQPPMGTTQEQRNKNYETFGGGVMLMEHHTK